ncbi:unnamed protein product [Rhizophagus irregularis]|uniref:Ubiquitin C n=5 Tax=Rhizophagus irregularis TaxID=588596 RepID=A0A916ECT8_9GLOM|nr:unnamed protein product [Rhizophagus irregularis]CAB5203994.1 unnamed protein product [Rhizophagus irregularis]CAB5380827.1 unnamed protein product [Rhizophagus irregularis]
MYLISVPNLPPVFSIRIEASSLYYIYKANVTTDTTVELLLKCFQAHVKDVFNYKLNYAGQDLQNTDTLKNLGLKEGSYIRAALIPLKLYVKMQDGKVIELHVPGYNNRSIYIIKSTISKCEGIPVDKQRLFFCGKELEDSSTLKYYNIQKESTLELILIPIELNVRKKNGEVIKLYVNENDTIHDVKQMIQKYKSMFKIELPVYKQCLLFCGEQLHDSSTLKSYNIQNESTLELAMVPFKLNVKTPDGKIIELSVNEENTIYEVKQIIQESEGIPSYKQRLIFDRNQLRGSCTLKYFNILEETTLELILAESSSLIHVRTLTGKNIVLSVCKNLFPRKDVKDIPTLHLVLRLRGGMLQETSGRIDFNALPSLMQYMQVPGRYLHDKVHAGIACNYCGKSEWKGARYKCSECLDYDLCYECIKISKLLHDEQHNFSEILDPENPDDFPKDIPVNPVTILPILPTKKEEMLTLLQEEEKRRFSSEIQQQYYKVGSDPTSGKDWMDVTDQMQHNLVREFGYSDEAVQLLRRAPQLYQDDPAFRTTQVYVRNNIASRGNLKEGMLAPDCPLVPLMNDKTIIQLRSLYRPERPFVLLAGSYTCPLYRYISHVLNDIYSLYKNDVDFYMIQIREAHASDVWPIGNIVEVKEHRTLEERLTAARTMVEATQLEIPVLADTMDNTFLNLYSPWPFRFFVIKDGILKLVGTPKEARYDTTDLVNCLDALLNEKII